jgi:hypothetical protein
MIKEVLDMALIDFMMVSSVFKKYNQFAEPSLSSEEARRVSLSVKELQYMDTFSQKLNHVLLLNRIVDQSQGTSHSNTVDHAGFIFKLNYAQATVASLEFVSNALDLQKNLHQLHDHIIAVTGMDFHEKKYFTHLVDVGHKTEAIKNLLDEIQQERYRESPITISAIENEIKKISDIYAMASERFVLLWLIKHSSEPIEDLIEEYKEEEYGNEEEIDLF